MIKRHFFQNRLYLFLFIYTRKRQSNTKYRENKPADRKLLWLARPVGSKTGICRKMKQLECFFAGQRKHTPKHNSDGQQAMGG